MLFKARKAINCFKFSNYFHATLPLQGVRIKSEKLGSKWPFKQQFILLMATFSLNLMENFKNIQKHILQIF